MDERRKIPVLREPLRFKKRTQPKKFSLNEYLDQYLAIES